MRWLKPFMILLCVFSGVSEARSQRQVSVAFWNVENLFDTTRSPFYDDSDYTPGGRNGWDSVRYTAKLRNLARVIDDAGFDVVALAEVENEAVVRDLVLTLSDDYNYIHRNSSDSRGIDLAMLYKGDKFWPETVSLINSHSSREFLHIRGVLSGDTVNIVACHMPSKQNSRAYRLGAMRRLAYVADSLLSNDPDTGLIIMGDFNCELADNDFRDAFGLKRGRSLHNIELFDVFEGYSQQGYGSYCWDGTWRLYDNIIISRILANGPRLTFRQSGIFIRDYMLAEAKAARYSGYPLRTFTAGRYTGGYSDHLPVYIILGH